MSEVTQVAENQSDPGSMDAFIADILETPEEKPSEAAQEPAEAPQEGQDQSEQEPEQPEAASDDGEPGEAEADQEAEEVPLYTVKINGVESQVPLDDLVAGYQKSGNYDQKMAELQQHREADAARVAEFEQERQQLQDRLARVAFMEVQEPDWKALAEDDPIGAFQAKLKWDQEQAEVKAERERIEQQHAASIQQQREQASRQLLKAANIKTKEEWESFQSEVVEGAAAYGFSREEVDSAMDHRILMLARDAAKYRKMVASKPGAKIVPKRPTAMKPGAANSAGQVKAEKAKAAEVKLKQTGDVDALADWLLTED